MPPSPTHRSQHCAMTAVGWDATDRIAVQGPSRTATDSDRGNVGEHGSNLVQLQRMAVEAFAVVNREYRLGACARFSTASYPAPPPTGLRRLNSPVQRPIRPPASNSPLPRSPPRLHPGQIHPSPSNTLRAFKASQLVAVRRHGPLSSQKRNGSMTTGISPVPRCRPSCPRRPGR